MDESERWVSPKSVSETGWGSAVPAVGSSASRVASRERTERCSNAHDDSHDNLDHSWKPLKWGAVGGLVAGPAAAGMFIWLAVNPEIPLSAASC